MTLLLFILVGILLKVVPNKSWWVVIAILFIGTIGLLNNEARMR